MPNKKTPTNKAAAINNLIAAGFTLIPLKGNTKIPALPNWQNTSYNPKLMAEDLPDNYGIVLCDNILVIDVDPRVFIEEDKTTLHRFLEDIGFPKGQFPETYIVKTGGKIPGLHLYFKKSPDIKVKTHHKKYGNGIEVKSRGAQLVGAGSIHPETGNTYTVFKGSPDKLLSAPALLLEIYSKTSKEEQNSYSNFEWDDSTENQNRFKDWLINTASPALEGDSGDQLTFRTACFGRDFALSEEKTFDLMLEHWNDKCQPPWTPEALSVKVNNAYKYGKKKVGSKNPAASFTSLNEAWPESKEIPSKLPPVIAFDFDMLPGTIKPLIKDISERMQCPPDFPAVAAMITIATIVGKQVTICPSAKDNWTVVPNLWGIVIGRPGVMKTPAMADPLKALKRLELEAREKYAIACQKYEFEKILYTENKKNLQKKLQKAVTHNENIESFSNETSAYVEPTPPARQRYLINDATPEKVGEILRDNPNGILVFRDELSGLLKSFDMPGKECARAFFLEAWNGTGGFVYDRISRGTIDIESACVSILGGIQPGILKEYLHGAIKQGAGDDGLIQRFQLAVWPDLSKEWKSIDRHPDSEAEKEFEDITQHLNNIKPKAINTTLKNNKAENFLRFTPEAQGLFNTWREKLEVKLRKGDEIPALEAHLSKYRSLIPSLALLIHLADRGGKAVNAEALQKALQWAKYLESHARRIYGITSTIEFDGARLLLKRIKNKEVKSGFTVRTIYRKQWSGLTESNTVLKACQVLEECHIIQAKHTETKGRSALTYEINPKVID